MKDLYIVANWKENKTQDEAVRFMSEFSKNFEPREGVKVIICPSFIAIPSVSNFIKSNQVPIETGVQNISPYEEGPHTGEISAREASEFAKFAIIGHSERRSLGETDEDVKKKVTLAINSGIEPIVCVQDENTAVPSGVKIVAYEPIFAIGTGKPDTPESAQKIAEAIKSKNSGVQQVLYGGSVTSSNVKSFCNQPDVGGVLVGGASLGAESFIAIIEAC
jgi:triosephosphate isomerase